MIKTNQEFTPTVSSIKATSPFINKTEHRTDTVKFECTGETHKMGKIYRVTEEFEMSETWFKVNTPTKEHTKVGDTIQVRPNDFKRYFELVEMED